MIKETLGKQYKKGDIIISQGEVGKHLFVIQKGQVEIVMESDAIETKLAVLGKNDFFGEMAIFEKEVRCCTVRAIEDSYILTVDKKNLLKTIKKDPSLAFRILEKMSKRIRDLNGQITKNNSVTISDNVGF